MLALGELRSGNLSLLDAAVGSTGSDGGAGGIQDTHIGGGIEEEADCAVAAAYSVNTGRSGVSRADTGGSLRKSKSE